MSGTKKAIDLSAEFLETFLSTLNTESEKEAVQQIVKRFVDCGLNEIVYKRTRTL